MLTIRPASDRGFADFGWLKSRHSFSFGSYYDQNHVHFGPLRVINEDRVTAGAGFDTHGHRNMEILTYVLAGALEHRDSTGTGSVIRPGNIQRMTAGRGIQHSEFNHSKSAPVHFLQICIEPDTQGLQPGYEQKNFATALSPAELLLIASPEGGEHAVKIHQDARLYTGRLAAHAETGFSLQKDRGVWVQVATGELKLNGELLQAGDGASLKGEQFLLLTAASTTEFLLFDLPLA